jgi:hypothetical protein
MGPKTQRVVDLLKIKGHEHRNDAGSWNHHTLTPEHDPCTKAMCTLPSKHSLRLLWEPLFKVGSWACPSISHGVELLRSEWSSYLMDPSPTCSEWSCIATAVVKGMRCSIWHTMHNHWHRSRTTASKCCFSSPVV